MASEVEIANRALTKIGDARITSLADNVEQARVVSSSWNAVRDNELRNHHWNFAITRTTVPALASGPAWGYAYQYSLPSDCLKVLQVGEYSPGLSLTDYRSSVESAYEIEGGKILTDYSAPLKIRYIQRVTNTGLWDSSFVEAFACRLAAEICERRTESTSKRQLAWEEYKSAIRAAVNSNAIETPPQHAADDTWIMSRL